MDEHRIAVASHQIGHCCEIDKNFCKSECKVLCGHEHHVNNPLAKCFSCQFHFEKNYDALTIFSCNVFSDQVKEHFAYLIHAATSAAKLLCNKGPPVTV